MQIITPTTSIERWLESVDHLIEKHRADTAIRDHVIRNTALTGRLGFVLGLLTLGGAQAGWRVKIIDTIRPVQTDSIVDVWHDDSFDAAMLEANHKMPASRSSGKSRLLRR